MDFSYEFITPEMAEAIIENSEELFNTQEGFKQRKVRYMTVSMYAKDMKEGRWMENGDPIQFDKEGRLMNGQHRLRAVMMSGVGQYFLVVRGVDNAVMQTIDCGLRRSTENYLQFLSKSYENGSAAVVRLRMQLDKRNKALGQSNANLGLSQTEMVEEYQNHEEEYIAATRFGKEIYRESGKVLNAPEVAAIYLHLTQTLGYDADYVKDFFFKLCSIRMNEKSIYNTTFKNLSNKKMCKGCDRIDEYMKCWNSMIQGKKTVRTNIDNNTWFISPIAA